VGGSRVFSFGKVLERIWPKGGQQSWAVAYATRERTKGRRKRNFASGEGSVHFGKVPLSGNSKGIRKGEAQGEIKWGAGGQAGQGGTGVLRVPKLETERGTSREKQKRKTPEALGAHGKGPGASACLGKRGTLRGNGGWVTINWGTPIRT